MTTHSLTEFYDDYELLGTMYGHYDGYPSSYGLDLAKFLKRFTIVDGLGLEKNKKVANGIGCLALQVMEYFKKAPGEFYLVSKQYDGDFTYKVKVENLTIFVQVEEECVLLPWTTVKNFLKYCQDFERLFHPG